MNGPKHIVFVEEGVVCVWEVDLDNAARYP